MRTAFVLLLFVSLGARSQTYFSGREYGVSAGATQYFGDLNDHYGYEYVRPYVGGFARFHITPYIAIRTALGYTHVGYDDKFNSNVYQRQRNLNFRSDIFEGVAQAEFNFFRFSTGEVGNRFTPYLTGGVGVFYYDPFTTLNGRRYDLSDIGTEGQNVPGFEDRRYGNFALCFPIGAGFKSWIRPGMNFGIEIANRLTLADYLDDVSTTYVGADKFPTDPSAPNPAAILQDRSIELNAADPIGRAGKQRGNSQTKDQYLIMQVNLSFQLKSYRCPAYLKEGQLY